MSTPIKFCLQCRDFRGRLVVFTQSNYDKHKRKHPELEDPAYFPKRVKNALQNPTYTVPGYKNDSLCYYVEEFSVNGIVKYTKVVVADSPQTINNQKVFFVKTTHKETRIRERNYPNLIVIDHRSSL